MRKVSEKNCRENQNTCIRFNKSVCLNCAVHEIKRKNVEEPAGDRWQYEACT